MYCIVHTCTGAAQVKHYTGYVRDFMLAKGAALSQAQVPQQPYNGYYVTDPSTQSIR